MITENEKQKIMDWLIRKNPDATVKDYMQELMDTEAEISMVNSSRDRLIYFPKKAS